MGPFVARGREIIGAWEKLPMPVIAALDGVGRLPTGEAILRRLNFSRLLLGEVWRWLWHVT